MVAVVRPALMFSMIRGLTSKPPLGSPSMPASSAACGKTDVGSIFGAVVGTLLIRSIDNGLVMGGVEAEYFRIALGAMIVFAVLLNTYIVRWFVGMRN